VQHGSEVSIRAKWDGSFPRGLAGLISLLMRPLSHEQRHVARNRFAQFVPLRKICFPNRREKEDSLPMPEQEPSQLDLSYSIEKPDWVALTIVIEEIHEELAQSRRNLLYCLSNWFLAVTIFKRFEERQMVMGSPVSRDREYHRVNLTGILASGEKLLHELLKHVELDTRTVGIDLQDVQAAVEELRMSYAEWFSDMTPDRKKQILAEVFGVED